MKVEQLIPAEHSSALNKIQTEVIISQLCSYFADKLREYNDSEIHVIGGIFSVVRLVFTMLAIFALLYFAAHKIDGNAFSGLKVTGWFDYLYISFDNMLFNMNGSAVVSSTIAKALSMSQRFLAAMLGLILLVVLFEVRKKKHSRQIEEAVSAAERASAVSAQAVTTQFDYGSLDEAIADLRQAESSMYAGLIKLLGSIRRREG